MESFKRCETRPWERETRPWEREPLRTEHVLPYWLLSFFDWEEVAPDWLLSVSRLWSICDSRSASCPRAHTHGWGGRYRPRRVLESGRKNGKMAKLRIQKRQQVFIRISDQTRLIHDCCFFKDIKTVHFSSNRIILDQIVIEKSKIPLPVHY